MAMCLKAFSAVVLLCEPFMVPIVLLIVFLKTVVVQRLKRGLQSANVTASDSDEVHDTTCSTERRSRPSCDRLSASQRKMLSPFKFQEFFFQKWK